MFTGTFKILALTVIHRFHCICLQVGANSQNIAKHVSDCVLYCLPDFVYLPTVKNQV